MSSPRPELARALARLAARRAAEDPVAAEARKLDETIAALVAQLVAQSTPLAGRYDLIALLAQVVRSGLDAIPVENLPEEQFEQEYDQLEQLELWARAKVDAVRGL